MRRLLVSLLLLVMISGCASMPDALQGDYSETVTPSQVANTPGSFVNNTVRWGGVIVEIINNEQETWIEILSLPISSTGRPMSDRQDNMGRFIAKTSQFLDPEVYQKGLMITVIGSLQEPIQGKVGERDYTYATVLINNHYLWPKRVRHNRYVVPGYWYHGFHPAWHFGYPYYGFGVWYHHRGYYPYFPVYGFVSRSQLRHHHRSGDFSYARSLNWAERQRRWMASNISMQVFPGAQRDNQARLRATTPLMTNNSPGKARSNSVKSPRRAAPTMSSTQRRVIRQTPNNKNREK